MLSLASLVDRIAHSAGAALLLVAGGANLGVLFLALLLNKASPGKGNLPLALAAVSWLLWVGLAIVRARSSRVPNRPEPAHQAATNAHPSKRSNKEREEFPVQDGFQTATSAVAEYQIRRRTFLPRIEAAQRSVRILVQGPGTPAWVQKDLRPLITLFVAVTISVPAMLLLGLITTLALLTASSPI